MGGKNLRKKYKALAISLLIIIGISNSIQGISVKSVKKDEILSISIETPEGITKIKFSSVVKNPKELGLTGILTNADEKSYENALMKTKKINFNPSQCNPYYMNSKQIYLGISDLQSYGSPGEPMVPMKTIIVDLPKNSEIIDVGMTDVFYREIDQKLNIIPNPEPVWWHISDEIESKEVFESIRLKKDIFNSEVFFPGSVVSYQEGNDNYRKKLFVRIFPIQNIPKTGRTVLITNGNLEIYYKEKEEIEYSYNSQISNAKNVIITPSSFYKQACELRDFHNLEGTSTFVVNTTWIKNNYRRVNHRNLTTFPLGLKRYDKVLAKKIISFLGDYSAHPNLEYVTLLGNARLIPPSNYFFFGTSNVPSDIYYASPDIDFVPNYHIGRLPVNNVDEATHVVNKIKNWNSTTTLFNNVSVAGGKPFSSPFDIGEMITTDSINRGFFSGSNITKYFGTDESFDKLNLISPLSGNTGILYHIGHGSGDRIMLNGEPISVKDLMELPACNKTPIVASIACYNGAFDTHISKSFKFNHSIGEATLLSNAGGIAYLGGVRGNAGIPIFYIDNGQVKILKEPYMAGMLTNFFEAYNNNSKTNLGELTTSAMLKFIEENDFSNSQNKYTYCCFVLLGDPALKLPTRPDGIEYKSPVSKAEKIIVSTELETFAEFYHGSGQVPICALHDNSTIKIQTNSPTAKVKAIDSNKFSNMTVKKTNVSSINNNITLNLSLNKSSFYSIRTITEDGKEGWFYVTLSKIVDDDFNLSEPGWQNSKWANIQEAIDCSQDGEIIFVLNGTYKENLMIDKPIQLLGENKSKTIIDGNQNKNVINIKLSKVNWYNKTSISRFTIRNSGNEVNNAGILIRFSNYTGLKIYDNIISSNQKGIYLQENRIRPTVSFNTIENNGYGIYIESRCNINNNEIKNNTYGFYISNTSYTIILSNKIDSNDYGIYLSESKLNLFYLNHLTKNKHGILLRSSSINMIIFSNFIKNDRHAQFVKCKSNIWFNNYWDNWIGLKFNRRILIPKLIFGRAGRIFGLIPWLNIDPVPKKTSNSKLPYFLDIII